MIDVRSLSKRFGPRQVLDGLTLQLTPGRVTALVGPNGAGKTTLIKCLLGLVRPDEGDVLVDGRAVTGQADYRADIGYMPQHASFPGNLSAREVLRLLADLRSPGATPPADAVLLDTFGLHDELDKPLRTLSGGTRQKVSAVLALRFRPRLLILDEPTAGLDPVASSCLKAEIRTARAAGTTVLLTSHIMSEVEQLADEMIFLLDGQVWLQGPIADFQAHGTPGGLEATVAALLSGATPPHQQPASRPSAPNRAVAPTSPC